jgi:predicted Zn-dependent protease
MSRDTAMGEPIAVVLRREFRSYTMATSKRMQQIEAMLADEPNDHFLRYGLAMEHSSLGDDGAAVQVLQQLMQLDPESPYIPAFLMCGQALVRLHREDEAIPVLKQGIAAARRTGSPEALHAMGELQGLLATIE